MRKKTRQAATREELLSEMDKKTTALKTIHRLCNEMLNSEHGLAMPEFATVKKIRYLAGAHYPALEPQAGDRLVIKPLSEAAK